MEEYYRLKIAQEERDKKAKAKKSKQPKEAKQPKKRKETLPIEQQQERQEEGHFFLLSTISRALFNFAVIFLLGLMARKTEAKKKEGE